MLEKLINLIIHAAEHRTNSYFDFGKEIGPDVINETMVALLIAYVVF